jgi:DNA-directed RNA polymerase subunit RPC12/RpoP
MAATISISCPKCKKQLNLPETLKGKKIRCKDCGTVFPVEVGKPAAKPAAAKTAAGDDEGGGAYGFMADDAPVAPPPPPPSPPKPAPATKGKKGKGDDDEDGANPYGVTETDLTPRCPHCAKEMESAEAIICLHCGYNTQTRVKPQVKRVYDITPQDRTMWIIPGIVNVFLIFFLIGLDIFFLYGLDKTWEWLDNETTEALSKGIRTWFVGGSLFAMWKCGRFAVHRLIIQPVPPEEEKK